jgi:DNA-binding IclR family transcriptional regulator
MNKDKLSNSEKIIKILKVLSREPYNYKAVDISRLSGINRTTIHRLLAVLIKHGFVIQEETSKLYKIGPMLYNIGSVYLNNFSYEDKVIETLNKISQRVRESVGYAVMDNEKVINLYAVEMYQPLKMNYRPGWLYPMNRGSYGKCLWAYYPNQERVKELLYSQKFEKLYPNTLTEPEEILKEYENIRKKGYVISDEETFGPSVVGVGVPVFNTKGEVKACIAMAFIKGNDYKEKIVEFKEVLLTHSKELTKYMPNNYL